MSCIACRKQAMLTLVAISPIHDSKKDRVHYLGKWRCPDCGKLTSRAVSRAVAVLENSTEPKPKAEAEDDFSKRVLKLARKRGWSYQRSVDGWGGMAAHTPGFPDLTLVRGREVIFAELKTDRGHLSAAQSELHEAWRKGGRRIRVWRPRDWADIEDALR